MPVVWTKPVPWCPRCTGRVSFRSSVPDRILEVACEETCSEDHEHQTGEGPQGSISCQRCDWSDYVWPWDCRIEPVEEAT